MTAIKAIHAGLRQLGIAEDDARDLYERQTGTRSLRAMTPRQHEAVQHAIMAFADILHVSSPLVAL